MANYWPNKTDLRAIPVSSAGRKLREYGWIPIVAAVALGALWQMGIFGDDTSHAGAPVDPYIDLQPGERDRLDNDLNATCLNRRLPAGVRAFWDNRTGTERINFTHKVRYWEAGLYLERTDRQHGNAPSIVRIHEDTLRSCQGEPDGSVEGKRYIREFIPHTHEVEPKESCLSGAQLNMTDIDRICAPDNYSLAISNKTLVTTCESETHCGSGNITVVFRYSALCDFLTKDAQEENPNCGAGGETGAD